MWNHWRLLGGFTGTGSTQNDHGRHAFRQANRPGVMKPVGWHIRVPQGTGNPETHTLMVDSRYRNTTISSITGRTSPNKRTGSGEPRNRSTKREREGGGRKKDGVVKDVCMCIQVKRETGGCTGGCNSGVIEGEPKEKRNRDRTKRYRGHERERGREMDDRIDDDLLHRSIDRKKKR